MLETNKKQKNKKNKNKKNPGLPTKKNKESSTSLSTPFPRREEQKKHAKIENSQEHICGEANFLVNVQAKG